jgi:hypothetical protein
MGVILLGLLLSLPIFSGFNLKRDRISTHKNTNTVACSATNDEIIDVVFGEELISAQEAPSNLPRVTWTAAAKGSVAVKENKRSVEEYMGLPASQYSVLSADQIERLSDTEFKCVLPTMNFFGTKICPILYVDVNVYPEQSKAEIVVSRAETTGSDIADKVNGTFTISAINVVSAGVDNKNRKTLNSDTTLKIDVVVPSSKLPVRVIQR